MCPADTLSIVQVLLLSLSRSRLYVNANYFLIFVKKFIDADEWIHSSKLAHLAELCVPAITKISESMV